MHIMVFTDWILLFQVDFSVVAPARIERPRYKEIEIPKFRIITEDMLNELAKSEKQDEVEEDSQEVWLRCQGC